MMNFIINFLIINGCLFIFLSALGVLRFPDVFSRLHAASKAASFGISNLILGVIIYYADFAILLKGGAVIFLVFLTLPVASHLIGRASYDLHVPHWKKMKIDEYHLYLDQMQDQSQNKKK